MLPDGSTIDSGFGANFEHHDHKTETMRTPDVRCKTSAPFTFDIDGLDSGQTCVICAWLQATTPDGAKASGRAQTMIVAATRSQSETPESLRTNLTTS